MTPNEKKYRTQGAKSAVCFAFSVVGLVLALVNAWYGYLFGVIYGVIIMIAYIGFGVAIWKNSNDR
jgi:Flp pilus assembly protein TadB